MVRRKDSLGTVGNNIFMILFFGIIAIVLYAYGVSPKTNTLSPEVAFEFALIYSTDDGLMGGTLTAPEKVYGQIMTYNEALQFVSGKSIDPNTKQYKKRNKLVWLIVLEGKFIEHVPELAGEIPETEVIHDQMVIIFDGESGEIMRKMLPGNQRKLSVANLPVLERTGNTIPAVPTFAPSSPELPYPTLPPVP